jgi:peptidyl-prolyl cis-trans isomerase SurA
MPLLLSLACGASSFAAETTEVVARVNGESIAAGEVRRVVDALWKDRTVDESRRRVLEAEALEQLIDRRLVLGYLSRRGLGLNRQEVRLAVQRFERRLDQQGVELADYLKKGGIQLKDLDRRFAWQLGWQRYLDRYLTDDNLAKFFQQHRRDFDGTEVRVAHVLLAAKAGGGREQLDAALKRAAEIRQEITSGELSFEAAAEKYSEAPTAKWGGDIGFITRHNMMPEPFAAAAFGLQPDEISLPVVTPFGVHLIKCVEVKEGKKKWTDVRDRLVPACNRYLFQWIAGRERGGATIEYTGAGPHFKPGTKELAE